MKLYQKFILALALVLALSSQCWAQAGNDFPPPIITPNVYPQPFVPTPNLSGQPPYVSRSLWGPYTLWEVLNGDTVEVALGMNWYPGQIWLSPMMDNSSGEWIGGGNWINGQLLCAPQPCYFRFVAGQDYPNLELLMFGPYRFWETNGAWLQVVKVIPRAEPPPPAFSVFDYVSKDSFGGIGNGLAGASSLWTGAGLRFREAGMTGPAVTFGAMAFLSGALSAAAFQWAKDPPNYDYCSPAEYRWDENMWSQVYWVTDYDPAGGYLPYSGVVMKTFGDMAQEAIDKATTAASDGNFDCAYARRWEAVWAVNRVGDWMWTFDWAVGLSGDAAGEDVSAERGTLQWAASVMQGVQ